MSVRNVYRCALSLEHSKNNSAYCELPTVVHSSDLSLPPAKMRRLPNATALPQLRLAGSSTGCNTQPVSALDAATGRDRPGG